MAARDRGRKRLEGKRPEGKRLTVLWGFAKLNRNGKKTDVIRQKGDSGVEDSTIASGVEGLSCRIINVI